jgi:hypothetical protein
MFRSLIWPPSGYTKGSAPVRSRGTTKSQRTKTREVKTRRDQPLIVADKKGKKKPARRTAVTTDHVYSFICGAGDQSCEGLGIERIYVLKCARISSVKAKMKRQEAARNKMRSLRVSIAHCSVIRSCCLWPLTGLSE